MRGCGCVEFGDEVVGDGGGGGGAGGDVVEEGVEDVVAEGLEGECACC